MRRVRIIISGIVQDVGFRHFIYRNALQFKLNGWVRNANGSVEAVFEGDALAIDEMIVLCRKGPRFSDVNRVDVIDQKIEGLKGFEII